jgi:uncharacterized cupredoxin-like copper-binding protein
MLAGAFVIPTSRATLRVAAQTDTGVNVNIYATEFSFRVSPPTVSAGLVHFVFFNASQTYVHEVWVYPQDQPQLAQMLALKRAGTDADENDYLQGIAGDVEDVAPGQVATFDALLTPGTYEMGCFKNTDITGQTMNHYDMGMHTLFTVTPLTPPDAGN